MKYLLISLLMLSMPLSAGFLNASSNTGYNYHTNLIKAKYRNKPGVIMYSYSWCGYCAKARRYFRSQGIPFVEYNIERDRAAKRRYDALRGRVTPLIFVGRNRMNGFSVRRFRQIYR